MSKGYKSFKQEALSQIDKAKKDRLNEAVIHMRNKVVEKLAGGGSGRTYTVPGTSVTYTASSPGQPPAVAMGDLRQSIDFRVEDDTGIVGSGLEKAPWLEFGTSKMAARPFMKPAFEEEQSTLKEIIGKDWLK